MRLFMVCLCLFFIATPAGADQVTPSDRVSNYVNVRQSADVNSPSVGILRPNQTATLIESIPYWHHVQLVDGTAGYVSKAWTVVVSGGTLSPAAGKTDLVLSSWNIKWFVLCLLSDQINRLNIKQIYVKDRGHFGFKTTF